MIRHTFVYLCKHTFNDVAWNVGEILRNSEVSSGAIGDCVEDFIVMGMSVVTERTQGNISICGHLAVS